MEAAWQQNVFILFNGVIKQRVGLICHLLRHKSKNKRLDTMNDNIDYCKNCAREHSYMSGPCEYCGGNVFCSLIVFMTHEYIQEKGWVTCEFSCSAEKLSKIGKEMILCNKLLEDAEMSARWIIETCKTCAKHSDDENPFHVSIERV